MEEVEILSNFSFVSKILPLKVKCEQEFASLLCEILFFQREKEREIPYIVVTMHKFACNRQVPPRISANE